MWNKGYKYVIGTDEAGRGPLAGPVIAAAITVRNFQFPIFNFQSILNDKILKQVKDSKQLSLKQREKIYNALIKQQDIIWGIGIVSENVIDKINIFEATKLAVKKAVKNLKEKLVKDSGQKSHDREIFDHYCFLILDGNFEIDYKNFPQKAIIKADQKVFSCALASIFAKVTRDKIMQKYHKKYPQYGFDRHKGYGTAEHFKMLEKYGPCGIHRKTFYPVKNYSKA